MNANREAAVAARFNRLLTTWLESLPGGWEGTPRELADTLDAWNESRRFFALVPHSGLPALLNRCAGTVTAAGWRVAYRRTAAARLVSFARVRRS
jgi:hypothetical protein